MDPNANEMLPMTDCQSARDMSVITEVAAIAKLTFTASVELLSMASAVAELIGTMFADTECAFPMMPIV
jgi:hypothetical protein